MLLKILNKTLSMKRTHYHNQKHNKILKHLYKICQKVQIKTMLLFNNTCNQLFLKLKIYKVKTETLNNN